MVVMVVIGLLGLRSLGFSNFWYWDVEGFRVSRFRVVGFRVQGFGVQGFRGLGLRV